MKYKRLFTSKQLSTLVLEKESEEGWILVQETWNEERIGYDYIFRAEHELIIEQYIPKDGWFREKDI